MNNERTIRIRNGFSDRNGIRPISKKMQLLDFDSETRIVLFNKLKNLFNQQIEMRNLDADYLTKIIVEDVFNDIYNRYRDNSASIFDDILRVFKDSSFDSVLDLIEFVCNLIYESSDQYNERYQRSYGYSIYIDVRSQMNIAFENEYIGYRFVGDKIVKITNTFEIKSLEESLQTPYDLVNDSIAKAISYISESGRKDYKNSIKESITALEQMANILLGTNSLALSNAISQLADKMIVDENLKNAIKNLYKFASDQNGIRHGNNKNNGDVTFDDAKFFLLTCSSIINYLCTLANKN